MLRFKLWRWNILPQLIVCHIALIFSVTSLHNIQNYSIKFDISFTLHYLCKLYSISMEQREQQPSMVHYAMNFGTVVGIYYIAKFCLFPMSLRSSLAGVFFIGLTLVVPFLIYRLTRLYRDHYMGGQHHIRPSIGLRHAYNGVRLIACIGRSLYLLCFHRWRSYGKHFRTEYRTDGITLVDATKRNRYYRFGGYSD